MADVKLSPSMMCADFAHLADNLAEMEAAGVDLLHMDIMDGHFVPNLTFGAVILQHLRPLTKLPMDAHLMVEEPDWLIPDMAEAGADMICVHAEARRPLQRTLTLIKDAGKKVGLALNPATPIESIYYVLDDLDYILIMSVNPGFAGQDFIPSAKEKTRNLSALLKKEKRDIEIHMDGSIRPYNLPELVQAGARGFVLGSGLFGAYDSLAEGVKVFREAAKDA